MVTFTPKRSCQLFLRSRIKGGGSILTRVALSDDVSRPIWAALPEEAGPDQEQLHSERMATLLGYRPEMRYHDLPQGKTDIIDDLLATRIRSL
jgi:hypothetical protein